MGLLSRKRRVPRIVKKTKTGKALGKKKISLGQVDPHIRRHWDSKKSIQENFDKLGLKLSLNPSFKYSTEGKETISEAGKLWGKRGQPELADKEEVKDEVLYEKSEESDVEESEVEEDEEVIKRKKAKEDKKPKLSELFKLKSEKEIKYDPAIKKLSTDDQSMMKQLIKKYGDNFNVNYIPVQLVIVQKMFKDIELNFMQYSKGQLKAKYKAYYHYDYENKK